MYGFVSRNLSLGLVYTGKIESIDKMCDSNDAMERWNDTTAVLPFEKRENVEVKVFGQRHFFKLPVVYEIDETRQDVTKDVIEYISFRASIKYISDIILGFWTTLVKDYYLYKKGNIVVFKKVDKSEKKQKIENQAALVLMKEYIDGYELTEDYSIKIKVGTEKHTQILQIQQDYEIDHPLGNGKILIKNNYTAALRYNIFAKMKQYATGENNINTPLMYDWQYDVLKRMGKRTVFVCPRRHGKSVCLAFIAMRAMMRETKAKALRPTSVLYIGLNEKSLSQVVHYLKKMRESFGEYWQDTFHYSEKNMVFSFRRGKQVLGTITFLSAEGSNPGLGLSADCVIIDEAFKIPRHIREGVEPIVGNEDADLVCASTMYYDAPKDWFYELLVQYEKEYNRNNDVDSDIIKWRELKQQDKNFRPNHVCGLRYTIDDPASMTPAQIEAQKKAYAKNPKRYFCELYSRVPDEGKVFRYEDSLQMAETIEKHRFQYIVLGYDPALRSDKSALVVLGYCPDIQRICVLEEYTLNTTDMSSYEPQVHQIKNVKSLAAMKYGVPPNMVMLVMDTTGAQTAIADLLTANMVSIDMRIYYGGGEKIAQSNIRNEYKVPKKQLVSVTKLLLESGKIQISSALTTLLKQLDNFYQIDIDKYGGVGENDDHVNAMMLGIFFMHERLSLKYTLLKESDEITMRNGLTYDEIREYKNSIESKIKRQEEIEANNNYFRKFVY